MRGYDFGEPPRTIEVSKSQVIALGPCLLVGANIYGNGADVNVILYDGKGTEGERKLSLAVMDGISSSPPLQGGIEFRQGIYAELSATTAVVSLSFYYKEPHARN